MSFSVRSLVVVVALCVMSPQLYGQLYSVIDLGTLGENESVAFDINNSGQIVGSSIPTGSLRDRAFLYANGTMSSLGTLPGGTNRDSVAYGINNLGHVVGYSGSQTSSAHAFAYADGSMTDLGTLGGSNNSLQSYAYDINDSGQIVGLSYSLIDGSPRAFLYENGVMTNLGGLSGMPGDSTAKSINGIGQIVGNSVNTPAPAFLIDNGIVTSLGTLGGNRSYAEAINNSGQIVGASLLAGNGIVHAVLWENNSMVDLGTLAGLGLSRALDVNDLGVIVGDSWQGSNRRAFAILDGEMLDLNDLLDPSGDGWLLQTANAVNDKGWIVGVGYHGAGQQRGFLLIPVPEPRSSVLWSLAMLAFYSIRIRRTANTRHLAERRDLN